VTRYDIWLKLGKPEGVYSVWSSHMWDEFGLHVLGRRFGDVPGRQPGDGIGTFEKNMFVAHHQEEFMEWLLKKFNLTNPKRRRR
jgi:hypothetical protein